jgi:hypothetical protein
VLATALAAGSIACGSDTSPSSAATAPPATDRPPTTTSSSSTTTGTAATSPASTVPAATTAAPSPEAEVIAAYQAFWDTWLRANDPPNPDHPDLARWYTGPALERARAEIAKNKSQGVVIRTRANTTWGFKSPLVEVQLDHAQVHACLIDDAMKVSISTGVVIDDEVVNSDVEAALVRTERGWAVQENRFILTRSGPECA